MKGEMEVLGILSLPGVKRSVAGARRFCAELLDGHPDLDDLQTCVSEAVTNAVLHSRSAEGGKVTVGVFAACDGTLVEVADDGTDGEGPVLREGATGIDGRGLWIIDMLAGEWGVRRDEGRTVLWMGFPGPDGDGGRKDASA